MGHEIKEYKDLMRGGTDVGYLYFGDSLWAGDSHKEEHKSILRSSERDVREILIAGGLTADPNRVVFDGFGSTSINPNRTIAEGDPTPVKEYTEALPGSEGKTITALV